MVYRLAGGALGNSYFYLDHGYSPVMTINSNENLSDSSIMGITCSELQKQYFICKRWDFIVSDTLLRTYFTNDPDIQVSPQNL